MDVCANPPVTETFDGSAVNAVNPAAPPPNPASLTYTWSCTILGNPGCPAPVNGGGNTTYISFTSNTLEPAYTYVLIFTVFPNGTDPNYQDQPVSTEPMFAFTTTCLS